MLTQHIALVPEAEGVNASELARVSAALQKQVTRDLCPIWGVSATVDAFPQLEDVPVGYWPIIVSARELGRAAGLHVDENGQPYARVVLSSTWSLDASRACLELLVNPLGDRTVVAPSPRSDQGFVEFLVEVCGPCEDTPRVYAVNDVLVSDFATPAFFGGSVADGRTRYSFHGALSAPFEPLPGGHVTWFDSSSNSWWLRSHWGENPVDTRLGAVDRKVASARDLVRLRAPMRSWLGVLPRDPLETRVRLIRQHAQLASRARAQRLRASFVAQLSEALPLSLEDRDPIQRELSLWLREEHGVSPEEDLESSVELVVEDEVTVSVRPPAPTVPAPAPSPEDVRNSSAPPPLPRRQTVSELQSQHELQSERPTPVPAPAVSRRAVAAPLPAAPAQPAVPAQPVLQVPSQPPTQTQPLPYVVLPPPALPAEPEGTPAVQSTELEMERAAQARPFPEALPDVPAAALPPNPQMTGQMPAARPQVQGAARPSRPAPTPWSQMSSLAPVATEVREGSARKAGRGWVWAAAAAFAVVLLALVSRERAERPPAQAASAPAPAPAAPPPAPVVTPVPAAPAPALAPSAAPLPAVSPLPAPAAATAPAPTPASPERPAQPRAIEADKPERDPAVEAARALRRARAQEARAEREAERAAAAAAPAPAAQPDPLSDLIETRR